MAACASVTVALVLADTVATAPDRRPAQLAVAVLYGVTVVAAVYLVRRGLSSRLLIAAGAMLMVLGVAEGVLLPNSGDAAVVLPVAGAVLALPGTRGRSMFTMLLLGSMASLLIVVGGYLDSGASAASLTTRSAVDRALSLLESGVLLAFTYGVLGWVGDRWWRADDQTRRVLTSQRRLLEVNERLLSTLDPKGVLDLIADSLKAVVSYDNLTIYRVDKVANLLRPVLARDRFAKLIIESSFPADRGITGWVVAHGMAQCVNDALSDPRTVTIPGTPREDEALIVVPLLVDGDIAGTLNMGRMGREQAYFSDDEFELARLFAGQASIAMRNAEALRAVATRAETDALTGLRNRGAFDERIASLIVDSAAQPLVLIMLDLDWFKSYNDVHGHPAGDALLQLAGKAISDCVREGDLCFRYGGDEFALLLPRTDGTTAGQIAERIRLAIAATPAKGTSRITASIGLGSAPRDARTADTLVAVADSALYFAKESGGDRVEVSGAVPPASAKR